MDQEFGSFDEFALHQVDDQSVVLVTFGLEVEFQELEFAFSIVVIGLRYGGNEGLVQKGLVGNVDGTEDLYLVTVSVGLLEEVGELDGGGDALLEFNLSGLLGDSQFDHTIG